jgi:hypothetical protein
MKLYLITHTGKIGWWKLEAWSEVEQVGDNGICIKAVKAFTKLRYAKDWIKKNHADHLIIKRVEIL